MNKLKMAEAVRSGAIVERKELTQWFFKISEHAEDLLGVIDGLDDWPAKVKLMQQKLDRQITRLGICI